MRGVVFAHESGSGRRVPGSLGTGGNRQVEEIRTTGGTVAEVYLRVGQPAPEVISAAELGADLLVVGSGGPRAMRHAVARTMRRAALGSVSDAIIRTAHGPVLVLRGKGASGETGTRPEEDAR